MIIIKSCSEEEERDIIGHCGRIANKSLKLNYKTKGLMRCLDSEIQKIETFVSLIWCFNLFNASTIFRESPYMNKYMLELRLLIKSVTKLSEWDCILGFLTTILQNMFLFGWWWKPTLLYSSGHSFELQAFTWTMDGLNLILTKKLNFTPTLTFCSTKSHTLSEN